MQIFLSVLGFILFIGLVLIHEWGHFIVARRNSVVVEEFGLGIPPRAWRKKLQSGLILSINWLPLGGFVKMRGEHDSDDRTGSFGAANLWVKAKIMLAGVTMNLVAGLAILTVLALIGIPKLIDNQFSVKSDTQVVKRQVFATYVEPDSPAQKAGLGTRDIIESITAGGQTRVIKSSDDLRQATAEFEGRTAEVKFSHSGKRQIKTVRLRDKVEIEASKKTDQPKGYLGLGTAELQAYRATWSAPIVALGFTKQLIVLTVQGIGHSLSGLGSLIAGAISGNQGAREKGQAQATDQVVGPIGVGAILWDSGSLGLNFLFMIIAVISLTLALMNLLPLPALDGGRLLLTVVSRGVLRRPLSKSVEERIVGASLVLILGLAILITVVDVRRFF